MYFLKHKLVVKYSVIHFFCILLFKILCRTMGPVKAPLISCLAPNRTFALTLGVKLDHQKMNSTWNQL